MSQTQLINFTLLSYLMLLLLGILIPACALSSPAFHMMYSAYKLNKQGDNIQFWCTPYSIFNQSIVPCVVLTLASWSAYRFLRRWVKWSGTPISLRSFHSLFWSTQRLQHSQWSRKRCFCETPLLSLWSHEYWQFPMNTGSSVSLKPSLNIQKFSVHILL